MIDKKYRKQLFMACAVVIIVFVFILWNVALDAQSDVEGRFFQVSQGQSFRDIARRLQEEGLIKNATIFKIYGYLTAKSGKILPGTYFLDKGIVVRDIFVKFLKGPEVVRVVIPEGSTRQEAIDILFKNKIILAKPDFDELFEKFLTKGDGQLFVGQPVATNKEIKYAFLKGASSFDGFLFPDTYEFFVGSKIEDVIDRFLENFSNKAWPIIKDGVISVGGRRNYYQILTMASLIEKEVPFLEDRLLVSGILWKRLGAGMKLQVDVAIDTYEYYGLPPKPIANPGIEAIMAAISPKQSNYWYYLSDPDTKKTIFSKDLDEHIRNKYKYLKK